METKKLSKEEKLEKEMKTLVIRMKNENSALNKILTRLKTREDIHSKREENDGEDINK